MKNAGIHASVQETTSADKLDTQLPRLAELISVWRKRSTFVFINTPYSIPQPHEFRGQSGTSDLTQAKLPLPQSLSSGQTTGLVPCVAFALEGAAAGQDSWQLQLEPPQLSPLYPYFSSCFTIGHFLVHAVVKAGINCLNSKEQGINATWGSNRNSTPSDLLFPLQ